MNISRLRKIVSESKLNKVQIAEKCGFTRVTLDNALQGADIKVSTIESLANVLNVSPAIFFEEDEDESIVDNLSEPESLISLYKKEIERLQSLLYKKSKKKVVVELELDDDEFIKLGLKDKVVQVLNK